MTTEDEGIETFQLYISPDKMASIARPVKEPKGFAKVLLAARRNTSC